MFKVTLTIDGLDAADPLDAIRMFQTALRDEELVYDVTPDGGTVDYLLVDFLPAREPGP